MPEVTPYRTTFNANSAIWLPTELQARHAGGGSGERRPADGTDRTIVFGFGDAIEAVGGALQAIAVEDPHMIAVAADQAIAFEIMEGNGDAGPPHAQQQ